MTEAPSSSARRYRGQDAAERQGDRRARLLAAALELFGTTGYAAVPVKQLCQAAGLTERYFYESFSSREDILTSLYDEQITQIQTDTVTAVIAAGQNVDAQARAGIEAFVRTLAADGRRARVIFVEVVGVSPALEERRRAVMHEFAALIIGLGLGHLGVADNLRLRMGGQLFVGGLTELMVDWTLGEKYFTIDELVDLSVDIMVTVFQMIEREVRPKAD